MTSSIKTLSLAALLGGALAISGCGRDYVHSYDNNIDGEWVRFYQTGIYRENSYLEVTRKDGTVVKYYDEEDHDKKIEKVEITKNDVVTVYERDLAGEMIVEEGQKQFDEYLEKIVEEKRKRGMRDISKTPLAEEER